MNEGVFFYGKKVWGKLWINVFSKADFFIPGIGDFIWTDHWKKRQPHHRRWRVGLVWCSRKKSSAYSDGKRNTERFVKIFSRTALASLDLNFSCSFLMYLYVFKDDLTDQIKSNSVYQLDPFYRWKVSVSLRFLDPNWTISKVRFFMEEVFYGGELKFECNSLSKSYRVI